VGATSGAPVPHVAKPRIKEMRDLAHAGYDRNQKRGTARSYKEIPMRQLKAIASCLMAAAYLALGLGTQDAKSQTVFEGARLDADLQLPIHLKPLFKDIKVIRVEKVRDRDAVLLLASNPGQPGLELFFDAQSGLLLRQLRFSKSPLGLNPTRTDYDDYKDFDGVKVPLHMTVARPLTKLDIQFDQVSQNVAVDDAQFEAPPPTAGSHP
jgi:hypothetical protein